MRRTVIYICTLLAALGVPAFGSGLMAQDSLATISIRILDREEQLPVIGAHVMLGDQFKAISNTDGVAKITKVPFETYRLRVQSVGFRLFEETIKVSTSSQQIDVELSTSIAELNQIVVTGTMRETFIKDSPVKVNVVSGEFLRTNPVSSLMETIGYVNGLYNQVDCAVCGTNNIRINGMEGPLTSVMIDGMPIMGSLASVYGFNGIDPQIIKSVEILKGPNSTLYGSEAMAGVINIITKDPNEVTHSHVSTFLSTHGEANFDLSMAEQVGKHQTLFSGNLFYFDNFLDNNRDGFADIVMRDRVSLFNKWQFHRKSGKPFTVAAKYYWEDRTGGLEPYERSLRGSSDIYGESIITHRGELIGSYGWNTTANIRTDFSLSYHNQDSFYGDYNYRADQTNLFINTVWDRQYSAKSSSLVGLTLRHDALQQQFDNLDIPNAESDLRFIPGIFGEFEYLFGPRLRGLVGGRLDHYDQHGLIFSPRLNLKVDLFEQTTLRINTGTGFRVVNLFTEEHEAISGARRVRIAEQLEPERSWNMTVNLNQIIDIGRSILNVDLDLFHTRFGNQIIPDYSIDGFITYANLSGFSVSQGIGLSMTHTFVAPFRYSIGGTIQDVFAEENGIRQTIPFAPSFNGTATLSYTHERSGLTLDYNSRIVGPMSMPEYQNRDNRSPWYSEHNVRLSRQLTDKLMGFVAVRNLFNYIQQNPLVAADRPFSDDFATDYVYGPLQARRFLTGVRWEF